MSHDTVLIQKTANVQGMIHYTLSEDSHVIKYEHQNTVHSTWNMISCRKSWGFYEDLHQCNGLIKTSMIQIGGLNDDASIPAIQLLYNATISMKSYLCFQSDALIGKFNAKNRQNC